MIAIGGAILAAGLSKRFGKPKLTAPINGVPMITKITQAALKSDLSSIVIVLGANAGLIRECISDFDNGKLKIIENQNYEDGQSTSIIAGLNALGNPDGYMFLLGDQPLVSAKMINRIIEQYSQSPEYLCVPRVDGKIGSPKIFPRSWRHKLRKLTGDCGALKLIEQSVSEINYVEFDNPAVQMDIDTPDDYKRVMEEIKCGNFTNS